MYHNLSLIAHKAGNKKDTASTSKHAFNLVGPHFLQSAFVDDSKTAEILSQGAGSQSTTAAVERFPSLLSSMGSSMRESYWFRESIFITLRQGHPRNPFRTRLGAGKNCLDAM